MATQRTLCDDWTCPAAVSCAHALGRSPDYASFKPVRIRRRDRQPGKEHCAEYRLDKPKPWLLSAADLATLENQGAA